MVTPVTVSENCAVTTNGESLVGFSGVDRTTVGATLSYVTDSWVATVLPFPARSDAEPAAMSIVTAPGDGVTSTVYVSPSTATKAAFVPPTTAKSSMVTPVTVSENCAVTTNGESLVGFSGVDRTTVGATLSYVTDSWVATVLPFPARSDAEPAAMSIVTAPGDGVTSTVYVSPSTATKVAFVPPTTAKSSMVTPVTVSENCAVTTNGESLVGFSGVDRTTVGAVAS